jgi:hypothetical protein
MWRHHLWLRGYVLSVSQHATPANSTIDTDNIINEKNGGYENVSEYIPIAQPTAATLSKLDELQPSSVIGDRASI